MLWFPTDLSPLFCLQSVSVMNCQSLYTEGQHVKEMKHAIFNCMLVGYYGFCSGPDGSKEGGWAALFYGKIQTRNLSSCSSSLFVSLCVYSPIFFLRKHNNSKLTWSQGEHDHGNHAGDQSKWRISGKWEVFALYSKLSISNAKGRLNLSGIRLLDLCTPVGTVGSVFPNEALYPGNVTGHCV